MTTLKERIDNWFNCYKRGLLTWSETKEYIVQDAEMPITQLRKYFVYLDDGSDDILRIAIPAKSEQDARDYAQGNGEIIAVKDVTDRFTIDASAVIESLKDAGFTKPERDFVTRTLLRAGIAE